MANLVELPRVEIALDETTEVGWEAVRDSPAGNLQGLNSGLVDGGFFLVDEKGRRIVGSDQTSSLNEGIRGVNSGDSFLDRRAKVRIPGSLHIFQLKITGNRTGHVIHADGRVAPELMTPDRRTKALVRLIGWGDFGRESTFYSRPEDGRRRYVPEPQPDAPRDAPKPVVTGSITNAVIVDEAGGEAVNEVVIEEDE